MADYFPLLSRTIASLGNSTPEQRQIVYDRARSVVADQLSAIEPPMDSDAINRELKLFEACVMRLEHEMSALDAIKPVELPSEQETRKHISARLSDLLAKAAAARAEAKQALLKSDITPSTEIESVEKPSTLKSSRPSVDRVPEPAARVSAGPSTPKVVERKPVVPSVEAMAADEIISGPEKPSANPDSLPAPQDLVADSTSSEIPAQTTSEAELPPSVSVLLEPVSLEQEVEGRLSMLADAEMAAKAEAELTLPQTDIVASNPAAATDGELTDDGSPPKPSPKSWLQKVQSVWGKKVSPTASAQTEASDVAAPADSATIPDEGGVNEGQTEAKSDPVEEVAQQVEDPTADEHFVGPPRPPVLVDSEEEAEREQADKEQPSPDSIVFSDDAAHERTNEAGPSLETVSTALKPPVASEIELLDDGRPRLAQRRKRDRGLFRGLVMGMAFLSLIAAVAGTAWVLRDRPADFEQGSPVTRSDLSRKITDRLPSEAVATPVAGRDPSGGVADASVTAGQRVILFEEAVEGQSETGPVIGRVSWALETIRDQTGAGDVAIKADIRDLKGSLTAAAIVIKRNRDIGFPASHLIELTFTTPEQGGSGRVRDIGPPEMRAEEGLRGTNLSGVPVPVTENVFLIGLTNLPDKIELNRDLLRSRNWMMIPMRFGSGRRAVLLVEKGLIGDRVLLDAFQAWK